MDAITAHAQLNLSREGYARAADAGVSTIGIGCVQGPDGRIWVTAMFAEPGARPAPKRQADKGPAPKSRPPPAEPPPPVPAKAESAPSPAAERLEALLVNAINEERGWGIGGQKPDPLLRQLPKFPKADLSRPPGNSRFVHPTIGVPRKLQNH